MKDDGTAELIAEAICNEAASLQDCDTDYYVLVQKEMVPLIEAALGMREWLAEAPGELRCAKGLFGSARINCNCYPCTIDVQAGMAIAAFDAILEKMGVQR